MSIEYEPTSPEARIWSDSFSEIEVPEVAGLSCFEQRGNDGEVMCRIWVARSEYGDAHGGDMSSRLEAEAIIEQ